MSSVGSGWQMKTKDYGDEVTCVIDRFNFWIFYYIIMEKHSYIICLGNDAYRLLLNREVNQAQENVLKLDEEGVRIHCPIFPRPETWHHPLLQQRNNQNMDDKVDWVVFHVNSAACQVCWAGFFMIVNEIKSIKAARRHDLTLKFSLCRWPCIVLYVALRSAKIWQSFDSKLKQRKSNLLSNQLKKIIIIE